MPDPTITPIHLRTVRSTLDEARTWAVANPGARAAIWADEQTAGRGRLGRSWYSPIGGCWMTIVWPLVSPDSGGVAGLIAAVAAAGVIESALGDSCSPNLVQIRWPNDLLIGGLKVGGVLGEVIGSRARPVLLLGIGINVNNSVPGEDTELRTPAIAIADRIRGSQVDLPRFTGALIEAISDGLGRHGPAGLGDVDLCALNDRLAFRGEIVRLDRAGIEGVLIGVDGSGRVLIEVDGARRAFSSGELSCRVVDGPRGV